MPEEMVVGLMFGEDENRVLLIRKKRPAWQAGLLNGPGGHVKEGETPKAAVVREFEEEVGLRTTQADWTPVVVLSGPNPKRPEAGERTVFFYAASGDIGAADARTDEPIERWPVDHLWRSLAVSNMHWIIPLAARARAEGVRLPVHVRQDGTGAERAEGGAR